MKKYLLFVGSEYYPCGGWEDSYGEFDSVQDAEDFVTQNPQFGEDDGSLTTIDWAHIVDTDTREIVWQFHELFNEATRRSEKVWSA